MNKKITDFIVKKKLISDDICASIIEEIEKCEWEKSPYGNIELDLCVKYPQYIAESINFYLEETVVYYKSIINDLMKTTPEYFFDIVNIFSRAKFHRYDPGKLIPSHYDHIGSLFADNIKGVPVLSAVGCLNNDYEGGEFVFYDDFKMELNAGEILLFPSNFMYPHRVEEVIFGSRYSFTSWGGGVI